jgi:hypothetical protein
LLIAETRPAGLPPSFDFIDYLAQDPVFARELASFRPARSVARFRIYERVDSTAASAREEPRDSGPAR